MKNLLSFVFLFIFACCSVAKPTGEKLGDIDFSTYMYNKLDIDTLLEGIGGDCPCPKYDQYIHWYTNMHSIALGKDTEVAGPTGSAQSQYSVVVGPQSTSYNYGNVVVGHRARAAAPRAVAVGISSRSFGQSDVAIGDGAYARSNTWSAIAIGLNATARNSGMYGGWTKPIAIGCKTVAIDGTAVGHHASVSNGMYSVAIGGGARVTGLDAIQIGFGVNDRPKTIKIGNAYFIDVQRIADKHIGFVTNTTGFVELRDAVVAFMEDLRTNAYNLPIPEDIDYIGEQPTDISLLAVEPEKASWYSKVDFRDILCVVLGLIIIGFVVFEWWIRGRDATSVEIHRH